MKLRTKFSFLTSILTITTVLGVSIILYIAEKQMLIKEMKKNQVSIVKGLSEVGKESLITSNEILLVNYLKKIKASKGVLYAMVTLPDGEIVAHTDVQLMGNSLKDPFKIRSSGAPVTMRSWLKAIQM